MKLYQTFYLFLLIVCNNLCITWTWFYAVEATEGRSPNYSYSDSWTAEELWPKEKSFIHVKLVRPLPKEIPVWELRNKDSYLSDPSLDFDSPLKSFTVNDCLIEFKAINSGINSDGLLQVQISGSKCISLPLNSLNNSLNNLTHLIIRDTGVVNLTKFMFGAAKLEKLTRIDIIDNGQLTRIYSRAFDGLTRLTYLSLINNYNISDINVEIFVGLKNLEELIWVGNGEMRSNVMFILTRGCSVLILPNLIHLHISGLSDHQTPAKVLLNINEKSHNQTPLIFITSGLKINKDDLNSLTHLKYLQLTNCDIKSIDPLAFVPLRVNLIGLNLSGNRRLEQRSLKRALFNSFQVNSTQSVIDKLDISGTVSTKSLPKDLLSVISKTKVTELYMNNLPLKQIVVGDIPPMPRIRTLHIEFSELEYIEESAFSTLENLSKLSLRGNFLKTLSSTFVSDLPNIEYLDISGYKHMRTEFEIPHKIFIGNNLKEVNLSYKLLDPLPRNAFLGLFKTQRFHLRGCGLKLVEYLTFFPLKSLIYIDLSENQELISTLRETHEDSLFGLEAVQILRMSHCNLYSRDITDSESIFKRIHEHVQLLDLSHNYIDQISNTTFSNFTDLQHLDLSYNFIKQWTNFSIFAHNRDILTLDISNNNITHLTSSMLEDFHRLKNLSFAQNPIRCDCQSQVVVDWLNDNVGIHYLRNRHPLHSKSQYYCQLNDDIINLSSFVAYCKTVQFGTTRISLALLSGVASVLLLFALIFLIFAFIYHSTLRSYFMAIDDHLILNFQYDAFVSYNVNDSEWVFKQLVPNIENSDSDMNHIKLCVYDRDFIAGRPISECILESIKTSRKVILVISNNFVRSPWCRFETDLAHNTLMDQNRDGLIMIKLEELDTKFVAPQLHFLLKTRIYLQWNDHNTKEQEIFWKKLKRALGFNGLKRHYYGKQKTPAQTLAPLKDNTIVKKPTSKWKLVSQVTEKIEISEKSKKIPRKGTPVIVAVST